MSKNNLEKKEPLPAGQLFLGGEGASFSGFIEFCKRNMPLVISVTLAVLFVYGVFLFNISVIGEAILRFAASHNPIEFLRSSDYTIETDILGVKRWTIWLFSNLFLIKESGVYACNFIAIVSIWTFSMLFCYFIAVFTKNTNRRNGFIPLALAVLTYPVWPMNFPNLYMVRINMIFIAVMLIAIYLFYAGFLSGNKTYLVISFVLTVLCFGSYQPFLPLFLCIVFIFFILLQENSNLQPKEYGLLCIKLFLFFLAAFILSFIIGRIVQSALNVPNGSYVTGIMVWNKASLTSVIANILGLGYFTTIGMIPFVHTLFTPLMETMYGSSVGPYGKSIVENVLLYSRTTGNILLLPAGITFIVFIFINAKKYIPKSRRLLYILAGFGVPLSIFFLVIVSGEVRGLRILYSLPFASAFMFYYVSRGQKTILRRLFYCLILAVSFYQAQVSQNIFEGIVRTSEYDTIAAFDINSRVSKVMEDGEKLPLAFIGNKHTFEKQIFPAFDITARSPFERWSLDDMPYQTNMVIPFMNLFGFNYDIPANEQIKEAYEASFDMPAYPAAGCVKKLDGVIVVKMGE
ncbi:MAG: glucosyltransferase domain-containing protein [Treponema sp.]|jgi:hypothetical protein|nr:glucosyltransferase domain-containing protein [Treponema sp.]